MRSLYFLAVILFGVACQPLTPEEKPTKDIKEPSKDTIAIPISDGFDFPVGEDTKVTSKRDGDGWYDAQPFRKNGHLGEDWNAESGGNTDCGKPVYAASKGLVVYTGFAGFGWGNVVIVRHLLPDSTVIETLYGHLDSIYKTRQTLVERREQLGTVGDGRAPCGDGKPYYAHLHFEVRIKDCPAWGKAGNGYAEDFSGWVAPSDFIRGHRGLE